VGAWGPSREERYHDDRVSRALESRQRGACWEEEGGRRLSPAGSPL